jgi:hypothetical protein
MALPDSDLEGPMAHVLDPLSFIMEAGLKVATPGLVTKWNRITL